MDPKQIKGNEDLVHSQQPVPSQQFSSATLLNQQPLPIRNPNPTQQLNQPQIVRRPSVTAGDLQPRVPQPLQRLDSRQTIGASQPQQQQQQQQQQQFALSGLQTRPIQPQQHPQQQQQQPQAPQYQQRPIVQSQSPQPRADTVVINRGPPPNLLNRGPQPQQFQNQPPNPQLQQQQQQQRLPLTRAPIQQPPAPNQFVSANQPNPSYQNPLQGQAIRQQPHVQNSVSDGVRLTSTPQQQYRPQVQQQQQQQPRPINPSFNQKLPTYLEERTKMATEVNQQPSIEKSQPSYIISNSDDVDDVIVRPISQFKIDQSNVDLKQSQPAKTFSETNNPTSVLQQNSAGSNIPKAMNPPQQKPLVDVGQKSSVPVKSPITKKSPTEGVSNGDKHGDEPTGRPSHSRASSHKSQEDVTQRSSSRSRKFQLEKPVEPPKKTSMNKIKVGNAPPPNLREVRSKIGSLNNTSHKPGGGNVKIENKKLEFNVQSRVAAKNESYTPSGGDKKIVSTKLQWNAKSKIGSLENANHKPGGGDKKILNIKTDYGSAKPKVGSKETNGADNKQSSQNELE